VNSFRVYTGWAGVTIGEKTYREVEIQSLLRFETVINANGAAHWEPYGLDSSTSVRMTSWRSVTLPNRP